MEIGDCARWGYRRLSVEFSDVINMIVRRPLLFALDCWTYQQFSTHFNIKSDPTYKLIKWISLFVMDKCTNEFDVLTSPNEEATSIMDHYLQTIIDRNRTMHAVVR